jgi:hypothetical protein
VKEKNKQRRLSAKLAGRRSPLRQALTVLAGIGLLATGSFLLIGQPFLAAPATPTPWRFSDVDNSEAQYQELVNYVESADRPRRLLQVDLARHRKVSQYTDIDSSPAGYGKNACGPVAAAAALGGEDWTPLVGKIVKAAGRNYGPHTGIQPTRYLAALRQVFGAEHVTAVDGGSLGDLYQALEAGHVVIVDIKVNDRWKVPSAQKPNYAHFARVLGIDLDRREIYIENTLRGKAYWSIALADFMNAWLLPETSASIILDPKNAEAVTRWLVVVDGALIPAESAR